MNSCKFPISSYLDGYQYKDLEQIYHVAVFVPFFGLNHMISAIHIYEEMNLFLAIYQEVRSLLLKMSRSLVSMMLTTATCTLTTQILKPVFCIFG